LKFLLSVVFGVAGTAKALDRKGTQQAVIGFGAPAGFAAPLAVLLPLAEIAVALGLFFPPTAALSAVTGLLLLLVFSVAIAFNLQQGRKPDCHCFGQIYSKPLGWSTLIRNLLFAAFAVTVIWQGPATVTTAMLGLLQGLGVSAPVFAELLFVLSGIAAVVIYLSATQRAANLKAAVGSPVTSGLPLGAAAPNFDLVRYHGGQGSLRELLDRGRPLFLIFANPNCGPCAALFREVAEWQRTRAELLTIAIISQGNIKENFVNVARHDLRDILLQKKREVAESYGALVTPTALIVRSDGRIGSAIAAGAEEIRALLAEVVGNTSVGPVGPDQQTESAVLIPRVAD